MYSSRRLMIGGGPMWRPNHAGADATGGRGATVPLPRQEDYPQPARGSRLLMRTNLSTHKPSCTQSLYKHLLEPFVEWRARCWTSWSVVYTSEVTCSSWSANIAESAQFSVLAGGNPVWSRTDSWTIRHVLRNEVSAWIT